MKRAQKMLSYIVVLALGAGLIYLILQDSSRPDLPDTWTTSYSSTPPENSPIVGLWMDNGQPVILAVVAHGARYFEYDALHPEGPASMLYGTPPIWWIRFPGAAR